MGRPLFGWLRRGASRAPVDPEPTDPVVTSRGLDGKGPRLRRGSQVSLGHVLRAAVVTGRTPQEVAARLAELGYRTADVPPASAVHPGDRRLMDAGWRGWLPVGARVEFQRVLAAALESGSTPQQVAARFGELGYRVDKVPATVKPHDPVWTSWDLEGRTPWLWTGAKVTAGHLLRAAAVTGATPAEVAHRLLELGYRVRAVPPPEAVQPGDRKLISSNHDGEAPWLSARRTVDVESLLAMALGVDSTPQRVAARLRELGYPVTKAKVPVAVWPHDPELISRDLEGRHPHLSRATKVTAGHLLRAAVVTGLTPGQVAGRMKELGFRTVEAPAADLIQPGDRALISSNHDGKSPWLTAADPVELGWLLSAALATDTAPQQVADRLRQFGYQVPQWQLPGRVRQCDLLPVSIGLDGRAPWLSGGEPVTTGQLLRVAVVLERTPAEIRALVVELGFPAPDGPLPPAVAVRPGDRELISYRHDGEPPWQGADHPVALGWLLSAALATDTPPRAVAARLGELGYKVPEDRLPAATRLYDPQLVSRWLNGEWPWLSDIDPVPVGHVLRAAIQLDLEVAEVCQRLGEFGFDVPKEARGAIVHPLDRTLISQDGNGPWLPQYSPVPLGRILAAALAGDTTPRKVADRLSELGYELPTAPLPALAQPTDLLLISRDADGAAPWRSVDDPVPDQHLQRAATAAGLTREQVIARLAELGYRTD